MPALEMYICIQFWPCWLVGWLVFDFLVFIFYKIHSPLKYDLSLQILKKLFDVL